MDDQLKTLRDEMDGVNARLVAVLQERARLVKRIGKLKRRQGLGPADPQREKAMMKACLDQAGDDGFAPKVLESLLERIFEASRRIVEAAA